MTVKWEVERLEEEVQELESKTADASAELDYVLELLDPIGLDFSEFVENVNDAVKIIKDVIRELN